MVRLKRSTMSNKEVGVSRLNIENYLFSMVRLCPTSMIFRVDQLLLLYSFDVTNRWHNCYDCNW